MLELSKIDVLTAIDQYQNKKEGQKEDISRK